VPIDQGSHSSLHPAWPSRCRTARFPFLELLFDPLGDLAGVAGVGGVEQTDLGHGDYLMGLNDVFNQESAHSVPTASTTPVATWKSLGQAQAMLPAIHQIQIEARALQPVPSLMSSSRQ
jgi:hypothetical protein